VKPILWGLVLVLVFSPAFGAEPEERAAFLASGILGADDGGLYTGPGLGFRLLSDSITMSGNMRFVNDGKWDPTESWMLYGYYFDLLHASVTLHSSPFELSFGYLPATHRYSQNPFEILLDANGKPAIGAAFTYDGTLFSYQTRWIGLNYRSPWEYGYAPDPEATWRDRGFNKKIYLIHLGNLRVGYQESSVFLDRFFDANFFLNPAPTLFVNTLWSQGDNPWVHNTNDSSYMGFYGDYTLPQFRAEAEVVIKDMVRPGNLDTGNLNKFAWSAGATFTTDLGNFSFWHGGATKHMFAASYSEDGNPNKYPYEYTYYPASQVEGRTIALSDNYIGFPYGENTLAFQLAWQKPWILGAYLLTTDTTLEWAIGGSQSPHNPWHLDDSWRDIPRDTELFYGDSVLSHTLVLSLGAQVEWSNFFLHAQVELGGTFNPLNLVTPIAGEPPLWRPQAGAFDNATRIELEMGVKLGNL